MPGSTAFRPRKYEYVYRLKREFPALEIIINGGIKTNGEAAAHLEYVDGVMVGREAYHNPMIMAAWDRLFYGSKQPETELGALVEKLYRYMAEQIAAGRGTAVRHMAKHYLGLMHGLPNARRWRRMLSDSSLLSANRPELILEAYSPEAA